MCVIYYVACKNRIRCTPLGMCYATRLHIVGNHVQILDFVQEIKKLNILWHHSTEIMFWNRTFNSEFMIIMYVIQTV